MKKLASLALVSLALIGGSAMAQNYVTVAAGSGKVNVDCDGLPNCKDSGTAAKVVFGYGLNSNLAVEVGYARLGEAKASDSSASLTAEASGLFVGGAYAAPLGDAWGTSVRFGIINVKTEVVASVRGFGTERISDTKIKPYVGFGVSYALNKSIKLGLDVDATRAEIEGEKASVRTMLLSATYAF